MNAEQTSGQERPGFMTRALVRGLASDVGVPLAYYALHLAGATDWAALLAATGVAACRLLWTAFKAFSLDPFAMLTVIVFGLGLGLSFLTGDRGFCCSRTRPSPAAVVFLSWFWPLWDIS